MLFKLDMYVCQGKELAWFKSYLSERFQSVKYDGVLSGPLPVTIGVPQGSIRPTRAFTFHHICRSPDQRKGVDFILIY